MSKYPYTSIHDLKDLADLFYHQDDYLIKVWNPIERQEMKITFTGCNNLEKTVHFMVTYTNNYHNWKWKLTLFQIKLISKWERIKRKFCIKK